jgi:hypothetical protein
LKNEHRGASTYPEKFLQLLLAVLPDDVARRPYDTDQALEQLIRAKPTLATDPGLLRLKNIWDRR